LFVLQVGERVRVTAVPARRTIRYNWKAMVQARHGSLKPTPPPTRKLIPLPPPTRKLSPRPPPTRNGTETEPETRRRWSGCATLR
jgi:hypothetical protein